MTTKVLSFEEAKSEARFFALASAVLVGMVLIFPSRLLIIPLAYTGWMCMFHGTTAVSLILQGNRRRMFQVTISLMVPSALSLYFIQHTSELTASGIFGQILSPWYLIPLGIIGYVSWHAGSQLDQEHPFRGFLIASAALFVICILGHHGIYWEHDDQTDNHFMYVDKETSTLAAQTGRYFGQFLVSVLVAYVALLAKLWRHPT